MYKVCKNKVITDKEGRKIAGQPVELDDANLQLLEDIGAIERIDIKKTTTKAAEKTTTKAAEKTTREK